MPSFENLHKNHKLAFLDGVLCGIAIAHMARQFYTEYRDVKRLKDLAEASRNSK